MERPRSRTDDGGVFAGVQPVLQLPFDGTDRQAIVDGELTALVEYLLGSRVDGLVVLGLASESWALTEQERDHVVELVATTIAGHVPLVVGIDGTTVVASQRAERAVQRGAAGLMVLPPSQATSADQVIEHFRAVAEAGGVPLLMQDSPGVTGVNMDVSTIAQAAATHPLVSSLKVEIPGSGPKVSAVRAAGVGIVAGWGGIGYLDLIERGAIGCMPGSDLGPALCAIDRAFRGKEQERAQELYRLILPLLSFQTTSLQQLVLCSKRHLGRVGLFSSPALRAPGKTLDALETASLDALLDELATRGVPGFTV